MADLSSSLCPFPFVEESLYPFSGGYDKGRLCSSVPLLAEAVRCCLPCPADHWIYPDRFYDLTRITGYINMVGLGLCVFMLLSFLVLPVDKTRRHYLNVCLIIATATLELGFIIPTAANPVRCHDLITPNDMHSSMLCAWSGALSVTGGVAVTSWVLVRAISMHLQICWDVIPGGKFFWGAQVVGWGICAALVSICLIITGVSFRFGDYCHVNQYKGLDTLWGPLLGIGGASMLVQLATFIYCLHVYLKSRVFEGKPETNSSRGASSAHSSSRPQTARSVYRRVRKVLKIQWRGLVIVTLVVADVVYFSVVFVYLDSKIERSLTDVNQVLPWVLCLIQHDGDKNQCLDLARNLAVNEATLTATLIMLAIVGIEVFLLVGRWSMITGWIGLFRRKPAADNFTTLETSKFAGDKRTYELLTVTTPATTAISSPQSLVSPGSILKTPPTAFNSPITQTSQMVQIDKEISREYQKPRMSFSSPRLPAPPQPVKPEVKNPSGFASPDGIPGVAGRVQKPPSSKELDGWV